MMRRYWKEIVALVILSLAGGALDARVGLSEDARFALVFGISSVISLIAFRPSKLRKLR